MSSVEPRRPGLSTRGRAVPATALVSTLALAGAGWIVVVGRMDGMDMGPGSDLGSFPFFAVTWTAMMAGMMLPSALPAVVSFERLAPRRRGASTVFAVSYVAVWALVGVAAFAADRGIRAAD